MAGDKAGGRDCLCPGISRSAQRAASFRSFPFVLRLSGVPVWGLCGIFTFFFIFFLIFQNAYNAHVPSLIGKWCLQVKPKREEKRGQPSGRGTQPSSRGPRLPQAVPQAPCPLTCRVPHSKGAAHSPSRCHSEPGSTREGTLVDGEARSRLQDPPRPRGQLVLGQPRPTPHRPPGPGEPFPRGCPRRPQHRSGRQSVLRRWGTAFRKAVSSPTPGEALHAARIQKLRF